MDMQISITPNSSDFLLWGGVSLIVLSLLYLKIVRVVEKTRRAFRALQPDLHISRSATIYSNGEDTLTIVLRNCGGSQAADIRVTVHGGEGLEPVPVIPVIKPGDSEYEVWVKAKSGSPLLQEKRDTIRLIIRYRDQWGHPYMLTYPVVQRESIHGWVALQLVERVKPRVTKPSISFWRMRMVLLLHSSTTHIVSRDGEALNASHNGDREGAFSQPQIHSYLSRVWQSQNKECHTTGRRRFSARASRLPSY